MTNFYRYRKNRKKGFTLVEMIASMAILGIIMVMVGTITAMSMSSFSRQKEKLDAINVKDNIIATIRAELQLAKTVLLSPDFQELRDENDELLDQTNDNLPDLICQNADGTRYLPVTDGFIREYNALYVHNGRIIKVAKDFNAERFENGTSNIQETFFMDDSLYHGYNVDVKFRVVDGNRLDVTVIMIDIKIFNGNREIYSITEAVTFVQMNFSLDLVGRNYPNEPWDSGKTVIYYKK